MASSIYLLISFILFTIMHPAFCKLSHREDPYSHSRLYVQKSLANARKFTGKLHNYSARHSGLSPTAIRALEDCRLLSDLNVDFLSSASTTLNSTADNNLHNAQSDDVHTLLSALITNQETCTEGLEGVDLIFKDDIFVPLANDTRLYSDSLALFKRAWGRKKVFDEMPRHSMVPKRRKLLERASGQRILSDPSAVSVSGMVVVGPDGTGDFTTISDAVNSAPNNTDVSNGYFLIYVNAGVYEEYVTIPKYKKYLMMIGDGINKTVVTGNHSNVDGWTTFKSATFAVIGEGFVAINMTFKNTAGPIKHQAVAVRNGADLSAFYSCSFEGHQDTLYAHSMRQFYRECDIYGTVDFIFGNAAVVFQKCNIYSRLPMQTQRNTITAQGRTDMNQNTGTTIQDCKVLPAPDLLAGNGSIKTYLGRPWKQCCCNFI